MAKKKRVRTDDPVKCIAHSSRTGKPCNNPPMHGGNVCRMHGGSAGQTRRRAAERIAMASDKAAAQLLDFMNDESIPANIRLAATKDLLDRAQVSGRQTIEIETAPWQKLLEGVGGIVATVEPGTEMRAFAETQGPVDPLIVEAERADQDAALTAYQQRPAVSEWNDPESYGDDLPTGLPHPRPRQSDLPPPATVNGDETPPPTRVPPPHRSVEPDEEDRKRYVRHPSRPPRPGRGGLSRRRH